MQASIDISSWQLGLFMLVLIAPLLINHHFKLALGRDISVAVVRMTLQLILVGLYLEWLFELNSPGLNLLWLTLMLLIGAGAILGNAKLPRRPLFLPLVTALAAGLTPLLLLLLPGLIRPSPVYSAQYLIPLAGMLLGNSLSGNIIALQRLYNAFEDRRGEYEAALALGARPSQAAQPFTQQAMQQSLAPILASMTTTGLVTLPGMMTGQILGGIDPMVAIKYQLVILVAIFTMLSISVAGSLLLAIRFTINASGLVSVSRR